MEGALEMGHARALLALDGARQIELGKRVAAKGLSVRDTEALVQQSLRGPANASQARGPRPRAPGGGSFRAPRHHRGDPLGKKGTGKVVVHYSSLDHLDELLKKLR